LNIRKFVEKSKFPIDLVKPNTLPSNVTIVPIKAQSKKNELFVDVLERISVIISLINYLTHKR